MDDGNRPRSRHAEALAQLVEERYGRMVRYAAKRLRTRDVPQSSADPEDVVQSALKFVLAHDEPIGNVRAYLYTCMAHEIDRAARHRYTGRGYGSLDADVRSEDEPTGCSVADAERRYFIDEALAELPRQQQKAFLLTRELGMTQEQAARVMGTATGTVGTHTHRAIKALRVALVGLGTVLVAWTTWAVASDTRQILPGSGTVPTPPEAMTAMLLIVAVTGVMLSAVLVPHYLSRKSSSPDQLNQKTLKRQGRPVRNPSWSSGKRTSGSSGSGSSGMRGDGIHDLD